TGLGVVAEFPENITAATLIEKIKKCFGTRCVRANQAFASAAACPETAIRRIALCGGSGGEFIPQALRAGAQVYITADVRYHDFADHREDIGILDIGHFESEACAKDIFYHLLTKKFPNFAVRYSKSENNPVHYL
ncbi:MAG: Nif3-like dinuclear metal center hexameric protein, partial [Muribaculaceae bacterium]|nr:Nif3-like dinuclear metal center hexameric protein [Muribaculaceae bacterium]